MEVKLCYPVILISKEDEMIYVFCKDKDLKSSSVELLKEIDFSKDDLIDSTGCIYKIKRAYKVKYLGFLGFNPLLKGRQIQIEFEYDKEVRKVNLDEFKQEIIRRIDETKWIWKSAWSIKELKQRIMECDNISEIVMLLK